MRTIGGDVCHDWIDGSVPRPAFAIRPADVVRQDQVCRATNLSTSKVSKLIGMSPGSDAVSIRPSWSLGRQAVVSRLRMFVPGSDDCFRMMLKTVGRNRVSGHEIDLGERRQLFYRGGIRQHSILRREF
jgi:hypothetical protein